MNAEGQIVVLEFRAKPQSFLTVEKLWKLEDKGLYMLLL